MITNAKRKANNRKNIGARNKNWALWEVEKHEKWRRMENENIVLMV